MNDMFTGLILQHLEVRPEERDCRKEEARHKEIMMRAERIPEALTEGLWGLI